MLACGNWCHLQTTLEGRRHLKLLNSVGFLNELCHSGWMDWVRFMSWGDTWPGLHYVRFVCITVTAEAADDTERQHVHCHYQWWWCFSPWYNLVYVVKVFDIFFCFTDYTFSSTVSWISDQSKANIARLGDRCHCRRDPLVIDCLNFCFIFYPDTYCMAVLLLSPKIHCWQTCIFKCLTVHFTAFIWYMWSFWLLAAVRM